MNHCPRQISMPLWQRQPLMDVMYLGDGSVLPEKER